jgi:hypothetical protein
MVVSLRHQHRDQRSSPRKRYEDTTCIDKEGERGESEGEDRVQTVARGRMGLRAQYAVCHRSGSPAPGQQLRHGFPRTVTYLFYRRAYEFSWGLAFYPAPASGAKALSSGESAMSK